MEVEPTKKLDQATLNCQPCYISSYHMPPSNAPISVNLKGGRGEGTKAGDLTRWGLFIIAKSNGHHLGLEPVKDLVTTWSLVVLHYHGVC